MNEIKLNVPLSCVHQPARAIAGEETLCGEILRKMVSVTTDVPLGSRKQP